MTDETSTAGALLDLNRRLLRSIAEGDGKRTRSCATRRSPRSRPESRGELVEGMDFHRFYFDRGGIRGGYNLTSVLAARPPAGRRGRGELRPAAASAGRGGQAGHAALGGDPHLAAAGSGLAARAFSSLEPRVIAMAFK